MEERPFRDLGKRVPGRGRRIYVAGALALTEPGPAAAGIVVADQRDRVLAQRSHYLGSATRSEAAAHALLGAARLALSGGLEAPAFRLHEAAVVEAISGRGKLSGRAAQLLPAIRETLARLPGYQVEVVPAGANLARSVALAPLIDWLPERTRRSEELQVRSLGNHVYEVESTSQPGQMYKVRLLPPGVSAAAGEDVMACECADFLYRGIPCKHLLAVARQEGALERLFYTGASRPRAAAAGGGAAGA